MCYAAVSEPPLIGLVSTSPPSQVMRSTSKEAAKGESELEKKLRSRSGIQAQVCCVLCRSVGRCAVCCAGLLAGVLCAVQVCWQVCCVLCRSAPHLPGAECWRDSCNGLRWSQSAAAKRCRLPSHLCNLQASQS